MIPHVLYRFEFAHSRNVQTNLKILVRTIDALSVKAVQIIYCANQYFQALLQNNKLNQYKTQGIL